MKQNDQQQSTQAPNKRHQKYFKHSGKLASITLGIIIVCGVWFFFGRTALSYYVPLVAVPVAFVLFLVGTVGHSTDDDIDSLVKLKTADMEIDLQNNEYVGKQFMKQIGSINISGYEYGEGLMIRRAKNSELRTPEYSAAIVYPLREGIYMVLTRVHILTETVERETVEIPYTDITDIRTQTETVEFLLNKKQCRVKRTHFEILGKEGVLLSLPTKESAAIDGFIDSVKRHIDGKL